MLLKDREEDRKARAAEDAGRQKFMDSMPTVMAGIAKAMFIQMASTNPQLM